MHLVKIGIANIDPTVGAFHSNVQQMLALAREAIEQRCALVAFSEQCISGYPAEDLVQWPDFVKQQKSALRNFARETSRLGRQIFPAFSPVFAVGITIAHQNALYNCAAVVCDGTILGIIPKTKLPTYGVFYEARTFSPGTSGLESTVDFDGSAVPFGNLIFNFPFGKMAVEVCEDIWSPDGPMRRSCYEGAEIIVNLSASPFRSGVVATRQEMISTRASDNIATVVYANQLGANDALVFDGGGFVNQAGTMKLVAPRWQPGLTTVVVDEQRITRLRSENTTWRRDQTAYLTEQKNALPVIPGRVYSLEAKYPYPVPENQSFFLPSDVRPVSPHTAYLDDLFEAMVWGLKGYFEKTNAFKRIVIALSGGKDSALTLLVAYQYAIRRFASISDEKERLAAIQKFIWCYSMPTSFNSDATKNIARDLCKALGVTFKEVPIEEMTTAMEKLLASMHTETPNATTIGNIAARVRGAAMWNLTNVCGGLWLQTSNMSEKAVGYCTVGGDMMGSLGLIANCPKTVVGALINHRMATIQPNALPALKELMQTKASAELAANQTDETDLMPFPILDACFYLYAGEKYSPADVYLIVRQMFSEKQLHEMDPGYQIGKLKLWVKKFIALFHGSIWKWVQTPESVHLGTLDLDRERALQLPTVESPEWLDLRAIDPLPD